MSKNEVWYGYLEAGNKSSPVVRDLSLETKSRKTVYLYNHARGCFLEYALEVVEPKLRELTADPCWEPAPLLVQLAGEGRTLASISR